MHLKNRLRLVLKLNLLKTVFYSIKFRGIILVGKGSKFNLFKNSKIYISNRGKLYFGVGISMPSKTVLDIYENGCLIIDGTVSIHKGCKVMIGENAVLKIGNKTYINENSRLHCRRLIEIGEKCSISWNVDILDTDEHSIIFNNQSLESIYPVHIGNHVWIGLKVVILKGTKIEDDVIVGAASLVKGTLFKNSLYAGSPVKLIKTDLNWQ
jgi:acetyltransferase-like isoleucine patch superfamily enzyme